MRIGKIYSLTKRYSKKLLILGTGIILVNYLHKVSYKSKIEIIYSPTEENEKIIKELKLGSYISAPYTLFPSFELFLGSLDNRHKIDFDRDIIYTEKGENMAVDYKIGYNKHQSENKKAVVILLPGMSGNTDAPYIK
jgi:hypothetical protein